ncbi:hypothetical protein PFISCL1PPCAC_139, partial [Pristionchus fissidentatus]
SLSDAVPPSGYSCPSLHCTTRPISEFRRVCIRGRSSRARSQHAATGIRHGIPTEQTEYAIVPRPHPIAQGELSEVGPARSRVRLISFVCYYRIYRTKYRSMKNVI